VIYIEDQHDRRLRTLLASWTLLVEVGGHRLIDGQEHLIIDVALAVAAEKRRGRVI
jgi:hypothetical protein